MRQSVRSKLHHLRPATVNEDKTQPMWSVQHLLEVVVLWGKEPLMEIPYQLSLPQHVTLAPMTRLRWGGDVCGMTVPPKSESQDSRN